MHILVSPPGQGLELFFDEQDTTKALENVEFRQQKKRLVAQPDQVHPPHPSLPKRSPRTQSFLGQLGFGGQASPNGGQYIRDSVLRYHTALFPCSYDNIVRMWMAAYAADTGTQKMHPDKELWRVRTVYGGTADGSPRRVGVKAIGGGVVRATVVHPDGRVEVQASGWGKELVLEVPSGGFYVMSGPGSGAQPDKLPWQHKPKISSVDAVVLIVDHYATLPAQTQQLKAAATELSRRAKLLQPQCAPATLTRIRDALDFETQEIDKSDGAIISLNHYWCELLVCVCVCVVCVRACPPLPSCRQEAGQRIQARAQGRAHRGADEVFG